MPFKDEWDTDKFGDSIIKHTFLNTFKFKKATKKFLWTPIFSENRDVNKKSKKIQMLKKNYKFKLEKIE